ncbi:MAG: hypothetical protein HS110_11405 [Zoogloeaceae bacterium]|nr:hypothetical protein [Zoogloeaceae bacterium]
MAAEPVEIEMNIGKAAHHGVHGDHGETTANKLGFMLYLRRVAVHAVVQMVFYR